MVGKAGLKAGLIGMAIMLVVALLNQVLPLSGALVYVSCGISSLLYAGIGVLAGYFSAQAHGRQGRWRWGDRRRDQRGRFRGGGRGLYGRPHGAGMAALGGAILAAIKPD